MTRKEAQKWADYYAHEAFEHHFQSRRGVWHIDHLDCLLYYNNNPYNDDSTRRPREMRDTKKKLAERGIKTLATGGCNEMLDDGSPYTVSLLLDCSIDRKEEVITIIREVLSTVN